MDLIYMEDGLVAGNTVYFDQLTFARRVGMLPPEGWLGDRLMTAGFNFAVSARDSLRRLPIRR